MRLDNPLAKDETLVANLVKKYIKESKKREIKPYCNNFLKGISEINILKMIMSIIVETIGPFSNTNVLINIKSNNERRESKRLRKKNKEIIILIGKKNLKPIL